MKRIIFSAAAAFLGMAGSLSAAKALEAMTITAIGGSATKGSRKVNRGARSRYMPHQSARQRARYARRVSAGKLNMAISHDVTHAA